MPQLPTPATTGDVWGANLNNFLTQLQSGTDGSINYSATRPTKVAADAGYTMIDTTTREIIRWSGTDWEVLMGGANQGMNIITQNTTFYVRQDGSDSNDGSADTATKAFKTLQGAMDYIATFINANNLDVKIKVADSALPYLPIRVKNVLNIKVLQIEGNVANPANVVIQCAGDGYGGSASADTYWAINPPINSGMQIGFKGFKLTHVNAQKRGIGIWGGGVNISDIEFTGFPGPGSIHMAFDGQAMTFIGSYLISGGAATHLISGNYSRVLCGYPSTQTISIINNPNFTSSFVSTVNFSTYENYAVFSGSIVTPFQYIADKYAWIYGRLPGGINSVGQSNNFSTIQLI